MLYKEKYVMNIKKRLLVLLITVSMLLSGSFVQAFAEEETVDSASVAVPETVSEDKTEEEPKDDVKETDEVSDTSDTNEGISNDESSEESSSETSHETTENAQETTENNVDDPSYDVPESDSEEGSDADADVEAAIDWEKTIPANLDSDIRKAVVQVAKSQLKYKESIRNYEESNGVRHAYTRYGEFVGDPYADEWDAEFVLFVLDYANVLDVASAIKKDKDVADNGDGLMIPIGKETAKWAGTLRKEGYFIDKDEKGGVEPEEGDLVFFDYEKENSEHTKGLQVGIITNVSGGGLEVILASTGTERNEVVKISCGTEEVAGYVSLKEIKPSEFKNDDASEKEAVTEKSDIDETVDVVEEPADDPKASSTSEKPLVNTSIRAEINEPEKKGLRKLLGIGTSGNSVNSVITLAGEMPEDAYAVAAPVDVEIEGQNVITAYDITIFTTNSEGKAVEWQPSSPLSVSIYDSKLNNEDPSSSLEVYHLESNDAEPELITETKVSNNKVVFEAESFSIYAISAPTYYITYEFYLDKEFTQKYEFELEGEESDKELKSNRIIVKNGDTLKLPAQPVEVENFRGWFTESDEEVKPGVVSGITQTETVKLYARNGDTAFVVFHERQITESSDDGTSTYFPVTLTSKVLLNNGSGSIDISDIEPQITYDDIEFVGWSTSNSAHDNERTVIDDQQVAASDSITSYEDGMLTITGNVNLYPVYKSVRFVRFYTGAVGSGASYISSSSVGSGEPLNAARPLNNSGDIITPTWTGYEFLGWTREEKIKEGDALNYNKLIIWEDAEGASQLDSDDYFENTAEGWDAQTEAVNSDIMLYAVWKPVSSARYHVAVWYESVNDEVGLAPEDKTYILHETESNEGKPGTLLDYTTEENAVAKGLTTPEGFIFSRGESATIEPDGSTTINVYFDRKTYTVIVKPGKAYTGPIHGTGEETVYARTDDTSGELYGSTSGKTADDLTSADVFRIEYRFKGWRYGNSYYTGSVYNAWWTFLGQQYSNHPGVNAGTIGYINPFFGFNTDTVTAEYAWYKAGTNEEYTGDRYREMEPYVSYYTGLYEQPIGFDYNLKYYYQPEEAKHIRLSKELNGNQYYLIRGESSSGPYYDSGFSDNETLYIYKENNSQTIERTIGRSESSGLLTGTEEYKALVINDTESRPTDSDFFTFPSRTFVDTPDLHTVELVSFNFRNTDETYRVLDISESSSKVTLYKASGTRFIFVWDWNKEPKDVDLYKLNSIGAEINNFDSDSNTLTVFADSEQSDYPAKTSYYKVDAPDSSASGFTPYANYNAFLNEYRGKVVNGEVSQFGGSGQTSTTVDVSGLRAPDAVLDGYTFKSYYNNSWKTAADSVSAAGGNDIKLLFEPNDVTVSFKYIDENNNEIDAGSIAIPRGFAFNCFTETGDNPNAKYVESYKDGAGITPPAGKVFDSWCYDVAGSQAFDPSRPVTSDINLYAKFDFAWYTANIDPKGGVIKGGSDGSTWFWRQSGSYIDRYDNIKREYIESDSGSYYYYYNDREVSETYSGQGNVVRSSGYINETDLAGWTAIDSTTYKDGDGNIYANVDTSVKYASDYHKWKLTDWYDESTGSAYDFSSPVTKDTYIYAVWKNLDTYKIRFDAGDGYHIGSNSIDVLPASGDSTTRTLLEHFIDNAEILIQYYAEPDNPSDNTHQFRGWRMKLSDDEYDDEVYQLGEVFNVDYHYADENGVITLEAVYDKLGTTSITYDANGGSGSLSDLEESGIQSTGNNRLYNIEINDKFNLSSGEGFTRTGYAQIGWSTDPDRKAEDFDPESNLNEDFDLGEEVLVDDISSNTLYAVWHCMNVEVYTYINGDWQNGTKIAEGEYAPASMPSSSPHQVQEAAKAGLTPNDYDLTDYTFGYAKINVNGTETDVSNVRFEDGKWEYSTDNGNSWLPIPVEPLRVYYYKTEIDTPVKYIKVENDGTYSELSKGTASGLVKNASPEQETIAASEPIEIRDLIGQADGLVNEYASNYSGYAYAIGGSNKDDGLYAISQTLKVRNDKDGFRYSTDGTNWTLWNINTSPHIYVVYYPKGFVYVTVKAMMTGNLVDTTLDIPYSYSISTTNWSRTIRRTNGNWNEGTLSFTEEVVESDGFTLKSGQSKVFVLNNTVGSSAYISGNNSATITAKTQKITISQNWLDYYTLEITDVKDADGSAGEGIRNDATSPGTYTISSVKADPGVSHTGSNNAMTYSMTIPNDIIRDDTTATFNNIRKLVKVDLTKTLNDELANDSKVFTYTASASETASDGSTISCDLDTTEISLTHGGTGSTTLESVPAGSRLLITETDADMYTVTASAVKTDNAVSDITDLLVRNNTVRFKVPDAVDAAQSVAEASFANTRKTVSVKILKVDELGKAVEGAIFVAKEGTSPLPTGSSLSTEGSSTVLDGEMYYEGAYTLEETVTPDEYKPASGAIIIRVSKNGVVTAASAKPGEVEVSGSVEEGYVVKIINEQKPLPAPTGYRMNILPFLLILAAGVIMILLIAVNRRRKTAE